VSAAQAPADDAAVALRARAWPGHRAARWVLLAGLASLAGCAGLPAAPGRAASTGAAADAPVAPSTALPSPPPVAAAAPPGPAGPAAWAGARRVGEPADPARTDLWVRVRAGFALADLGRDAVARWERTYAARPEGFARLFERGSPYLFHIVEEVERRGLPMELALLPFVESAFDPQAVSSARAAGMWQFIPSTGRAFELRQNAFRDDRRDVIASTRAALDYLEQLHERFGDWHLALAAYNWGQGSVQRAQRRNQARGRPTGYASLRMPDETRQYVPKLLAVRNLVLQPEVFGLTLPRLENHPWFLSVSIANDIDLALAARLAGMDEADFLRFNPQLEPPLILAAGTPQLLLPYDAANRFLRALGTHQGPLASWTAWVAPRTLTTTEAARLTGMQEPALRAVNDIPPRMKVKAGSILLVPRSPDVGEDIAADLADNGTLQLTPERLPTRRVVLRVGARGDTVAGVARRHRLAARDVARWNKVSVNARFRAGARVVVMLPQRVSTAAVPVPRASTRRTTARTPPSKAATQATRRAAPGAATASPAKQRPPGGG
jgi:membrane-bound lytic murein transglycosylase D